MYASYSYISLGLVKKRVNQRKQPSKKLVSEERQGVDT